MALGEARQAELWVCLNPAFCDDRVSRVLREVTFFAVLLDAYSFHLAPGSGTEQSSKRNRTKTVLYRITMCIKSVLTL